MKIQILGRGCAKCNNLTASVEETAQELGLVYELEKVTEINDITAFGVMSTPALVIDGEVKTVGKIPTAEELKNILLDAQ